MHHPLNLEPRFITQKAPRWIQIELNLRAVNLVCSFSLQFFSSILTSCQLSCKINKIKTYDDKITFIGFKNLKGLYVTIGQVFVFCRYLFQDDFSLWLHLISDEDQFWPESLLTKPCEEHQWALIDVISLLFSNWERQAASSG